MRDAQGRVRRAPDPDQRAHGPKEGVRAAALAALAAGAEEADGLVDELPPGE